MPKRDVAQLHKWLNSAKEGTPPPIILGKEEIKHILTIIYSKMKNEVNGGKLDAYTAKRRKYYKSQSMKRYRATSIAEHNWAINLNSQITADVFADQ